MCNEAAAVLANRAAATVVLRNINQFIPYCVRAEHNARWRRSYKILQDPHSQLAQDLLLTERRNLKYVVKMITGYGQLLMHMQRMRIISGVTTCTGREEQEEGAEHLLFECGGLGTR